MTILLTPEADQNPLCALISKNKKKTKKQKKKIVI
jgi:hypothetical protein